MAKRSPLPFDTAALIGISGPREWLIALVNQAIERNVVDPQQIVDLQLAAEYLPGEALARLRQAVELGYPRHGLAEIPMQLLFHIRGILDRIPTQETWDFYKRMRMEGGDVGYDDQGRLIWKLPGDKQDTVLNDDGKSLDTEH